MSENIVAGYDCDGNELEPLSTVRPIFYWASDKPEDLPVYGVMQGKSGKWYLINLDTNNEDIEIIPISEAINYEIGLKPDGDQLYVESYENEKYIKFLSKY